MLKLVGIPAAMVALLTMAWWFSATAAEPAIRAHSADEEAHPKLRRELSLVQSDVAYLKAQQAETKQTLREIQTDIRVILQEVQAQNEPPPAGPRRRSGE